MGVQHLVAMRDSTLSTEAVKRLADQLGSTAYEIRQRLAVGRGVAVMTSGSGPYDRQLGALRTEGLAAAIVDEDLLVDEADAMFVATALHLEGGCVARRQHFEHPFDPNAVAWMVRGEWSDGPAANVEGYLILGSRIPGETLVIRRSGFDYSLLGASASVGARNNFDAVVELVRRRIPHAPYDDSLAQKGGYGSLRHLAEKNALIAACAVGAVIEAADAPAPAPTARPTMPTMPTSRPSASGPLPPAAPPWSQPGAPAAANNVTARHGMALEANSQILWGTASDKVIAALRKRGALPEEARALVREAQKERRKAFAAKSQRHLMLGTPVSLALAAFLAAQFVFDWVLVPNKAGIAIYAVLIWFGPWRLYQWRAVLGAEKNGRPFSEVD